MFHESFLTDLLSAAGDVAYDWDLGADRITWFGAIHKIFGETPPPANSELLYNAIYEDDRHIVFGGEVNSIDREYRFRLPDGKLAWVQERGQAEYKNHQLLRQRGVLRVIDKKHVRLFDTHENRDPLTSCLNRGAMQTQITKALDAAKLSRRPSAYLVIAIDKMSFVNEAVGMEAGDGLLRGVAQRLAEIIPPRAVLGRVGGDMFGILLPEPLGGDFQVLAERLLQNFRNQPIVTSVVPLHITVSIGGVRLPSVAHNATEAMIFAEQALHDAHQRGHNLFIEYIDSPERMQQNRMTLEMGERVKLAFKQNSLRLAFQPVVAASDGRTVFYEALVRMFGDDGQIIPAAQFVPVIEQLGLAFELDCYVLDLAVKELEAQPDLELAINISGLTAVEANWPDHMRRVLGHRRDVTSRLIVEITETAAIVDVSETRRFIDFLRELGGRVSLDDFGAGFTSIRHLRSLSLSIMKIDKELLSDVLKDREQQHIVRMLIEIARGLGLKTVAEGVETAEIAEWLRKEKVDMLQGYYFGKPALERVWFEKKGSSSAAAKPAANTEARIVAAP